MDPVTMMSLMSAMGGGLSSMFGGGAASKAQHELGKIPDELKGYYQPYIDEYNSLMQNPGSKINEMGESFHQSPGFQFALDQALRSGQHSAAAGGMAGSPEAQQKAMQTATGLANQDYYHWLEPTMDLFKTGLGGGSSMSKDLAESIANVMRQKASLGYQQTTGAQQGFGNALGLGAYGLGKTKGWI